MNYNLFYVVNQMLKANREGDLVQAAIWADWIDELSYIY